MSKKRLFQVHVPIRAFEIIKVEATSKEDAIELVDENMDKSNHIVGEVSLDGRERVGEWFAAAFTPDTYSEENIEKLVQHIVGNWDQNSLIAYAVSQLTELYEEHIDEFIDDWENEDMDEFSDD